MQQDLIRYRTRPERAAVNEQLIRAVYEELREREPDGLSYATFLLADQVTFLHLVRTGSAGRRRGWRAARAAAGRGARRGRGRCRCGGAR
jgi:hypothetical protein